MPEISEMPIMPPREMGGADFSDESDSLEEGLEDSEGNGENQKMGRRVFDEKRA
nr:hypothetical protein [uncultured Capnocytophaga sp.]